MEELVFFQSSGFRELRHGFFGSKGGISTGLVKSLNCYPSLREKRQQIDDVSNVDRNRKIILETLKIGASGIVTLNQVHSDVIVEVKQSMPMDFADADGIITDVPNLPIGILTADCVPILYTDIHHKVIGAVHAGWKGCFLDIHLKMVMRLNAMGIPSKDIKAAVGPSIQQPSYEVDQGFYDRYISKNKKYQSYFYASAKESYYQFDLARIVYDDLMAGGLYSVDWVRLDTFIHDQLFFSHRRATLSDVQVTGRQLSVICL